MAQEENIIQAKAIHKTYDTGKVKVYALRCDRPTSYCHR